MKTKILSLIALVGLVLNFNTVFATDWTVDKDHSTVGFTVRHLVSKVNGTFTDFSGQFSFDEKKPEASQGIFVIKAISIDTNNQKRDDHLRSPDFFDATKFPDMSIEKAKVVSNGKNKYKLNSNLVIKGISKPVVFAVELLGTSKDPWGGTRIGFTASSKINRKDFGITWNKILDGGGVLIGDDVDVVIQVEAVAKVADKK